MGITTNKHVTLEERIRSVTKAAQEKNADFDLCFIAARGEWSCNLGSGYTRSRLEDLLELIEEDIRNPVPETPSLPEDPEDVSWKS
jgi:hypothetical protein